MDWVGTYHSTRRAARSAAYGTGRVVKNVSINPTVDAIVGADRRLAAAPGWPGMIPGAGRPMRRRGGGAAYVGQGVTGLVGGGILTAIVGLIKNMTMPKQRWRLQSRRAAGSAARPLYLD